MNNTDLETIFIDSNALLHGHFKLSSGRHADKYLQCAKALQYPEYARTLGGKLADCFEKQEQMIVVSPALGGLIIGHEVASALGVRFIFTERKDGEMTLRRGFELKEGTPCIIIEDVITTGKSTSEVVKVIEKLGAKVIGIGCLANRSLKPLDLPFQPVSILELAFDNWDPEDCPLCKEDVPLTSPGSRFVK